MLAFTTKHAPRRLQAQGGLMLLASSSTNYPILDAFWTILMIFLWVIWFWILITIFIDLFRSHDLSGWAKALWFIFILIFPLIGVLVYLIARGSKMHEHEVRDAQQQEQQFRRYVQEAAGTQSSADQLAKLADLRDRGVITPEEFESEKAKILAGSGPQPTRLAARFPQRQATRPGTDVDEAAQASLR
jgi:ABC-type multidrug transport system fused ATPase/permease subunit